jgi:hypothetical protein
MESTLDRVLRVLPSVGIKGDDGRANVSTNLFRLFVISDLAGMRRARDGIDGRSAQALRAHVLPGQRCEQSFPIRIAVSRY